MTDHTAPSLRAPLSRAALLSVILAVGVYLLMGVIDAALVMIFTRTPPSNDYSSLGPILLVGFASQVLWILLLLVVVILGLALGYRGMRSVRLAERRGRAVAVLGVVLGYLNLLMLIFAAWQFVSTIWSFSGHLG